MKQEIWKDIKDYEGLYQVSNLGRVKSLERKDSCNHIVKEKILKPDILHNGYCRVRLASGHDKKIRVHRLVAEAFIPNFLNKPQVNHIDGNKQNNRVENLEWVTESENMLHSYKIGLQAGMKGDKHPMKGKIGILNVNSKRVQCINTGEIFDSIADIERKYGINHSCISWCCKGKYKSSGKHPITGEKLKWKYLEDSE